MVIAPPVLVCVHYPEFIAMAGDEAYFAIAFTGFYGDYVVEVAGRTLAFELVKGKTNHDLR
jgi:hypothetical protein